MIYLAAVLVLLWLLVGGYLVFMLKRQQTLEKDLAEACNSSWKKKICATRRFPNSS